MAQDIAVGRIDQFRSIVLTPKADEKLSNAEGGRTQLCFKCGQKHPPSWPMLSLPCNISRIE